MKLVLSLEEVRAIVYNHLTAKGYKLSNPQMTSHVEGEYEDSREIIDGMSFNLLEK